MSQNTTSSEPSPFDYPNGHLNHLSAEQERALEEFKTLAQDAGCYTPPSCNSKASHGDDTLLRFLRARSFVPEGALQQFQATEEWRKEEDIDHWYDTIDIDEYEKTRLLYTQWTGRRDKRGLPLYVFDISGLDPKKISQSERSSSASTKRGKYSSKMHGLFATYDHLLDFVMPLCSSIQSRPYPETGISQTTNIVDISGMGLRQFWGLKQHLQDASALATAHYPETLGRTFIVGAPGFFPTVWNLIKHWYDPVTVAKVFILPQSEVRSVLEEHIELSDIPKRYGGTLDWNFGDLPILDAEISQVMKLQNGATTIPTGPIRWRQGKEETGTEAHALGSKSGEQRDDVVAYISSPAVSDSLISRIH